MSKLISFVPGSHPGEAIKESINNFLVAWGSIEGLGRRSILASKWRCVCLD